MLNKLDLRGTPCPVNFVRCRLALEKLSSAETLEVDIDKGEPQEMVSLGLKKEGYNIKVLLEQDSWIRLLIISNEK